VASFVALLRGIAPMHPKMRNTELTRVFEQLGFERVRPVIASGNLVFESGERAKAAIEAAIEAALLDHLGASCTTIVRSRRQIERLLALDVFDRYSDEPAERCNVTFLKRRSQSANEAPVAPVGAEVVATRDQAVFSVIDTTRSKTPDLMARLERAYGPEITTRTWRTVHRIARVLGS